MNNKKATFNLNNTRYAKYGTGTYLHWLNENGPKIKGRFLR